MAPNFSKCTHITVDDMSEMKCRCPTFVPRIATDEDEANVCNGCLHSISWHTILEYSASPPPTQSTSAQIDAIISTYTTQASAGSSSSGKKMQLRISETSARKEATSGLKRSHLSDEEFSPKVTYIHRSQYSAHIYT